MLRGVSPPGTSAQPLLAAAAEDCRRRRCEAAIGRLEEAVRLQPGDAELCYQLGFCYSGGCRQHRLVLPEMAEEYLRHALSLVGTATQSVLRAKILDALGNTLTSYKPPQAIRLREAIAFHQAAAGIYRSHGMSDDWAREEFNQANAWCDLPDTEFPAKWNEAVTHYENALRIRTKDKDPKLYAATALNLGTALRRLPAGPKAENILKAVRCYHAALQIHRPDTSPSQFANVCNNLGNACLSYPARDEASRLRHVRHALLHFERALQVWNCATQPYYFALAQYNRGCAYLRLAASPGSVQKALACLTAARECAASSGHTEIARLAETQAEKIVASLV